MVSDNTRLVMSLSAKARCTKEWREAKSSAYRTKIDDDKLNELYSSGMTKVECAKELGVGRKVVENAMKRLGIKSRKAAKRFQIGESNHMWRGDSASMTNKHRRLYRAFGQPSKCDVCGTEDETKSYDWANLTGDYNNPQDFKRMCRSCHWKYDNKIQNITKNTKKGQ